MYDEVHVHVSTLPYSPCECMGHAVHPANTRHRVVIAYEALDSVNMLTSPDDGFLGH
jgi:hypothetical protein